MKKIDAIKKKLHEVDVMICDLGKEGVDGMYSLSFSHVAPLQHELTGFAYELFEEDKDED